MCRRAGTPGSAGGQPACRPAPAQAAAEGSSLHLSIYIAVMHCPVALPQIRPAFARQALSLGTAPSPDASMIARHEHLRHGAPLPPLGASILRIFEQALRETFLGERLGASDHTRQQSYTGVDQRDRRGLAARQHKVAEA